MQAGSFEAPILRAGIVIVAVHCGADACTVRARVVFRAQIIVVAGSRRIAGQRCVEALSGDNVAGTGDTLLIEVGRNIVALITRRAVRAGTAILIPGIGCRKKIGEESPEREPRASILPGHGLALILRHQQRGADCPSYAAVAEFDAGVG